MSNILKAYTVNKTLRSLKHLAASSIESNAIRHYHHRRALSTSVLFRSNHHLHRHHLLAPFPSHASSVRFFRTARDPGNYEIAPPLNWGIRIVPEKSAFVILASEAARMDQVNRAEGEADAILARARATAEGLALVSQTLKENGGLEAASLRIAEQYVQAFSNIAKEGTTMLLPSSASNPANMMAQALTMYKSLVGNVSSDKLDGTKHPAKKDE